MKEVYYIAEKTTKEQCGEKILPLIDTLMLKDENLESKIKNADSLIFTSKRAIIFLQKQSQSWQNLPCYVLGQGTQSALNDLGLKAFFCGKSGYGDTFAKELQTALKHKKPLFIHGEKTASNLSELLCEFKIHLEEAILYKSATRILTQEEKQGFCFKKDSIFFFSSPSRIDAFLQNFTWKESFIALCIGVTTANYCKTQLPQAQIKITKNTSILESLKEAQTL